MFPHSQFVMAVRFAVLMQLGENVYEVMDKVNIQNPETKEDWVMYHIYCMGLIKHGKFDAEIEKLKYGVYNNKFHKQFLYLKLHFLMPS